MRLQVSRRELDTVRNCKTLVHKLLGRVRSVRKVLAGQRWSSLRAQARPSLTQLCGCRSWRRSWTTTRTWQVRLGPAHGPRARQRHHPG